ncbi:MAG TPA: MBL fold metallo-hydrolase [Rickettsiales bacterium]|nr:MBL fold metallo-hydrolase [Rickettsiales bacterium]
MKITILGSGGAYGTPKALNRYGEINISDKKNFRTRSSLFFEDEGSNILIDCSPDFRMQTLQNNISKINTIFISHDHADHIIGIWELTDIASKTKSEIKIWGEKDTLNTIKLRFPFIFKDGFHEIGEGKITLNEFEPYKEKMLEFSNFSIIPLIFKHKVINSYGFKYKNFVFTPDLNEIPQETEKYLYNLDLWILENNNLISKLNGHSHIEQNLERIQKYKPKKVILNHLSENIDYEKVSKMLPDNVELAYDGMVFEI